MTKQSNIFSHGLKVLLIVGVGRSGTSLLHSMLNAHSKIDLIPEINYIRRFLIRDGLKKFKNKNDLSIFLSNDARIKRLKLDLRNFVDDIDISINNLGPVLYAKIFQKSANKSTTVYVGDKDPRSIEYLPAISRILPSVKFIHVLRDPRDVVLSKIKANWSANRSILTNIFAGTVQLKLAVHYQNLFPSSIIQIRYEDLVTNPKSVLEKICSLLNLDYEAGMLDYQKSAQTLIAADEYAWKKETLQPIISNNINKWKTDLTKFQINLVEELNPVAFGVYHYTKAYPEITYFQKLVIYLIKLPYLILATCYCKYRLWTQ